MRIFKLFSIALMMVITASAVFGETTSIKIQGHRGCRGNFPENSLTAFEAAIENGIDVLEMDLAVTRDGILVVSHDPHINPEICVDALGHRITNPPLINHLTLAEVKTYHCGSLTHPRFPHQTLVSDSKIPTLAEVFALVRESSSSNAQTIGFNIETKIFPDHPEYTVGPDEFSRLVVDAFLESGFIDRITLQSFDPRTLIKAKKLYPRLKTVALTDDSTVDMISLGQMTHAYALSPDFALLSSDLVATLHAHGFLVIPWTVNEPTDWQNMLNMKVDGIITDYPMDLAAYLRGDEGDSKRLDRML